jgi:hypothetical protein
MTAEFWRLAWPAGLILVLFLVGMNAYFLVNRRLFDLLKKENWPALADYLGEKVYKEGKYSSRNVRLLAHAYIVSGNFEGAARLEEKAASAKPALLDEFALLFGVARILGGNAPASAEFFKDRLEKGNVSSGEWFRWYYGFSLLLARSLDQAQAVFGELAAGAKDTVVAGLSAYFLSDVLGKPANAATSAESLARAEEAAGRVRGEIKTLKNWEKKAAKVTTEVHGAVIRKYIKEAGEWLFKANGFSKEGTL